MRTLGVLASGSGTNFEALATAAQRGELGGHIAALVSDRPEAPVLDRARRLGIEALVLPVGRFRTRLEDETPWIEALKDRGVDCVLLAGFMRRLHTPFISAFRDQLLNLHPSLLPAFPGLDAIRQAWQHGVHATGCTVHMVDEGLDSGPILAQSVVDVREGEPLESLVARVHEAEHRLYPAAVRRFTTESWRRDGRRIVFDGVPAGGPRG
ncbi:MAG: phosphoribosylglycinamide formyltransferase [Candidatus Eisenbacteria bacterium]|uniref:Phosphoribosylglycinamide formyltransferase n=1 Tax=Eiseniibacteriota bacterium TaxID=2212470 RepID=A0A849SJ46_UNCEI|nr:phosphoribosylglycinamide formyltransferase [Candidatus Eisenbacteria bacterium]